MARSPGPVPKRSDERIRRNIDPAGPVEKLEVPGTVDIPELNIQDAHPFIEDFYEALKASAQTQYYEPSDWQFARWVLFTMNDYIKGVKPSAVMFQAINSALADLLVTEAERRRVRLEIERNHVEGKVLDVADRFAEMLKQNKRA